MGESADWSVTGNERYIRLRYDGAALQRLTATQPLLQAAYAADSDRLVRFRSSPSPGNVPRRFSFRLVWRLETTSSRARRLRAKPRRRLSRRNAAISFGTNQAVTLWLAFASI